jgi:alpha-beta hydrolase superfamily lysophospholipase
MARIAAICLAAVTGLGAISGAAAVEMSTGPARSASRAVQQARPPVAVAPVRVYLMRGLFDVFSLGIDSLGSKLRHRGYQARTFGVANWQGVQAEIVQRLRIDPNERILVIGHSLGADAAVRIANQVGREGLPPLALVVAFDPVSRLEVTGGTHRLVNLFQSNNGWAVPLRAAPGFAGRFSNEDLRDNRRLNHLNIDKDRALHDQILGWVAEAASERSVPAAVSRRPTP